MTFNKLGIPIWEASCTILPPGSVRYKELYNMDVDLDELDLAEERCCYRHPQSGCSDEFTHLSEIIREKSLQFPHAPREAATLYVASLEEISKI